ncbi:MAG: replication-associated recombination protein A [Myxococcota bacterium]
MRPRTLEDYVGQDHVVGPGKLLRRAIEGDRIPSMILWGPPGTGKTTLAQIIAHSTGAAFETLSAVASGVKDIRAVIARAKERRRFGGQRTVLFIDEIHRFNKSQQDALLPHVEAGVCRLIGATTENPSFEVNAALLSRARVFSLRQLGPEAIASLLSRALTDTERGLGLRGLQAEPRLLEALGRAAQGDARRALTTLEMAVDLVPPGETSLLPEHVGEALGGRALRYDKAGEEHYNVVSAFIKSMRASDVDASVYWLARMLESGEDLMFVARRIVIFASEDVGNADPQGLVVATAAAEAAKFVGLPEAVLPLSQAVQYLALAPKSNTALKGYFAARKDVRRHGALPVPMAVRNAVTKLMKQSGYGAGYRYPHEAEGGVDAAHVSHLPEAMVDGPEGTPRYVKPARGWEAQAWDSLQAARGGVDSERPENDGAKKTSESS